MENEKIYVFDAYGTLFDVDHACKEMAIQLGGSVFLCTVTALMSVLLVLFFS